MEKKVKVKTIICTVDKLEAELNKLNKTIISVAKGTVFCAEKEEDEIAGKNPIEWVVVHKS